MKGEPLGPLHGVPFSIKDMIFTRGLRTTGGSRLFADLIPEHDSVPVGRLSAAGAVILGKTTTSEFGHKAITDIPLFGVTRNPWDPSARRGLERRRGRRRGRGAGPGRASAPTVVARCGSQPRSAGSSDSSRPTAASRSTSGLSGLGARRARRAAGPHGARRRARARRDRGRRRSRSAFAARGARRRTWTPASATSAGLHVAWSPISATRRGRRVLERLRERGGRVRGSGLPRRGRESRLGESRGSLSPRCWPPSSTRRGAMRCRREKPTSIPRSCASSRGAGRDRARVPARPRPACRTYWQEVLAVPRSASICC